jgi:energy-coupling factor transporter ATP-binding protein EcfA2
VLLPHGQAGFDTVLVVLWIILLGIATIWIALRVHPVHRAEDELDDHGRERLCAANKHRMGNFAGAWARGNFSTTVFNSVVITLMKVPLGLLIAAAAASLGLEPLLGRYPRQLSGGQRQRVAIGGAIVRDPKVFLFDEPLSNLDAKLRVQVRGEIKELQHRLKTTTIYLIHHQVEAMTMGYKIVVMNGGQVEQVGPPLELYDRPANTFVATFLDSPAMNLLPGRIEGEHSRSFPCKTVSPRQLTTADAPSRGVRFQRRAALRLCRRRCARRLPFRPVRPRRVCSRSS